VSLILDALKKLEREKEMPDRGFLVLSHLPWALGSRHSFTVLALILLGFGLLAGGGLGLWIATRGKAPAAPAASPAAKPSASSDLPANRPVPDVAAPPPRSSAAPSPVGAPEASRPSPASGGQERSPARPRDAAEGSPPAGAAPDPARVEFRLNAITVQDGHPVAILNDRLVREGDSFGGIRVIRIGEAEVEIEVRGERRLIRF
jgi:hypothetical protein